MLEKKAIPGYGDQAGQQVLFSNTQNSLSILDQFKYRI